MDEIIKFDQQILKDLKVLQIKVSELQPDTQLQALYQSANPISLLNNQPRNNYNSEFLFNLSALISPVIAYSFRKHYRYLVAHLTVTEHKNAIAHKALKEDHTIPVFLLTKKPPDQVRLKIVQFELTQIMLERCFVSDTTKILNVLEKWFERDEGKKSIFQSAQWQSLYPEITTVEAFAKYISVSKKKLRL